jgi:hypothetical protein
MIKQTVLRTTEQRGSGLPGDPVRMVHEYYNWQDMLENKPGCPFLITDKVSGIIIYNGTSYMSMEHLQNKGVKFPKDFSPHGFLLKETK